MILSHLKLAHSYWEQFLKPGDFVIDATCGNGHDALVLARSVLTEGGSLACIDLQKEALEGTRARLSQNLPASSLQKISYHLGCHAEFPPFERAPRLIVYNLGYLPGRDKMVTTRVETTLKSLEHALQILKEGGALSITCYPGHEEGRHEQEAIIGFAQKLDPLKYKVCHHSWLNRPLAPSLLIIQNFNYQNN